MGAGESAGRVVAGARAAENFVAGNIWVVVVRGLTVQAHIFHAERRDIQRAGASCSMAAWLWHPLAFDVAALGVGSAQRCVRAPRLHIGCWYSSARRSRRKKKKISKWLHKKWKLKWLGLKILHGDFECPC